MSDNTIQTELSNEARILRALLPAARLPILRMRNSAPVVSANQGYGIDIASLTDKGVLELWFDRSSGQDEPLFWCGLTYTDKTDFEKAIGRLSADARPVRTLRQSDVYETDDGSYFPKKAITHREMLRSVDEWFDDWDSYYLGRYFSDYCGESAVLYIRSLFEHVDGQLEFWEGEVLQRFVNLRERDTRARAFCLAKPNGLDCSICGMNFGDVYGEVGEGFIHVHHTFPLSNRNGSSVTLAGELVSVCPNCHAMLHRRYLKSPNELRRTVEQRRAVSPKISRKT